MRTTTKKTFGQLACLAAALMALWSCRTRPLDYVVKEESSGIPILISGPGMGPGTKAAMLDSTTFDNFGIYAGWARDGQFGPATVANDYMNGSKVKKDPDTGVWSTEVKYYWPAKNNGAISFFAFAPHIADSSVLRFAPGYTSGVPVLRYTPPLTAQKQMDLCIAGALYDRTVADNPLSFHFRHTLTNIQFWANYSGSLPKDMYLKVDRLTLRNIVGTKDLSWTKESPGFGWSADTEEDLVDYTLLRTSAELTDNQLDTVYRQLDWAKGILLLLPQTINEAGRSIRSTLEIEFSIFRKDGNTPSILSTFNLTANLPEGTQWEPASEVVYHFTLSVENLSEVQISASSSPWTDEWIDEWEDSGNKIPETTIKK